jgi:hypothetical protein
VGRTKVRTSLPTSKFYFPDAKPQDVIIRGGEVSFHSFSNHTTALQTLYPQNLFPVQIENALTAHHYIREAAAVSVPDSHYGEVVGAWVVLEPHAKLSKQDVRQCVTEKMNPQVRVAISAYH